MDGAYNGAPRHLDLVPHTVSKHAIVQYSEGMSKTVRNPCLQGLQADLPGKP
jgi:hypothetical protein